MTTSIPVPTSHKKRKNATDPGHDSPKKKKKKKEKNREKDKLMQDKEKSRIDPSTSEFFVTKATLKLSIPPLFAGNLRAGAEEMLDSMIMRYIPSLSGVLLAHSNLRFLNPAASIIGDCPFAVCTVGFDATVWSPTIAMKLVGRVILCSPDQVMLLVHRIFNVSIPCHHIPQDVWEFEYGPAENDPEYGAGAADPSVDKEDAAMNNGDHEMAEVEAAKKASGRWVHRVTGTKLGGADGYLEFTVVGQTVANEMLSLQGSIQYDPFSPEHVNPITTRSKSTN